MIRALVIDDDPKLAALLAEYLGGRGLEVRIASDGERGLEAHKAGCFDVIVFQNGI